MTTGVALRMGTLAFMGIVSAVLLLRHDPEYMVVTSADGVLTVTGFARGASLRVAEETSGALGIDGTVYHVTPDGTHDLPTRLLFAGAQEGFGVLHYDDAAMVWVREDDVQTTEDFVTLTTHTLGRFALHAVPEIDVPDFVSVYDALRDHAPDDAVGYRIAVGYRTAAGALVRLDGVGEHGGCGGAVLPGETIERAADERTASVLVDDVQTPVTFVFVATWHVDPGGSCPALQPFHAADEYGILPSSP